MARRIALAGIGKIARDQHIPSIAASDDWELAATVSRSGGIEGVETHATMEALLSARPDIEVVSLTMPPASRYGYARAALEAGRHVMLEKPPGATLAEVQNLAAIAEERGLTLFASWHSREAAMARTARDWLEGRDILSVEIEWLEDVRRWHPGQDWVWEPGGLGVFDPGINALSLLTKVLPRPMHLTAATLTYPENRQTPIAADLKFVGPGAATTRARFDWRHDGDQTWAIRIATDAGEAVLSDGGASLAVDGAPVAAGADALSGEYPRLYGHLATLIDTSRSDVDLGPMIHVADAFALGRRETAAPFHF
ncbi:Gfo/Idh/MocA family protein [Histidinibacterium lentulum]|uniref:Gfo/Idh/MocA family oxidoreductase n=1 Tax=Histidinibacterium lentulum TaxID=2480588 RepID=A0A3N2R9B3_9RHOB|nr:Gfo/Idh/MocA family oxidoreductase [Histidinibacterium lentulum]ROU04070.1 gfo/Idh/MocA family oxidoreductase [Histidinibacterium lentulum]